MASLSVRRPQLPELVLQPFPHDPDARSCIGGPSTTIFFVNHLPDGYSAQIYSIDDRGERTLWRNSSQLRRSEYFEVTAYMHQPWEVVFSNQGRTITKIYHPQPNPSCVMLDKSVFPIPPLIAQRPSSIQNPRSVQDSRPTHIKFVNLLQTKVNVRWVDCNGDRQNYRSILPGHSSLESTFVGHLWEVVTADFEKTPVALFYATPYDGLAEIDDRFLSGPSAGV